MAGTLNGVDDSLLGEDDFQDVKDAVSQLAGVWQGFGSVLGLLPSTIREIQATYAEPSRCLDEVLERWLKENYNTKKFPPPSWKQLVLAVQNKNGGKNPALAKKVAAAHQKKDKLENQMHSSKFQPVVVQPNIQPVVVQPNIQPVVVQPNIQPVVLQSNTQPQVSPCVIFDEETRVPEPRHVNVPVLQQARTPEKQVVAPALQQEIDGIADQYLVQQQEMEVVEQSKQPIMQNDAAVQVEPVKQTTTAVAIQSQDESGISILNISKQHLSHLNTARPNQDDVAIGQACQETGSDINMSNSSLSLSPEQSSCTGMSVKSEPMEVDINKEPNGTNENNGIHCVPGIGSSFTMIDNTNSTTAPRLQLDSGPCERKPINPNFFPHHERKLAYIVDTDGGKEPYEYFDAYKPEMPELKLSFDICIPQIDKHPDSNFEKYAMECFPHGVALIINNETFRRQKIREGTDIDEANLVQLFRYLGYRVEVHRDKKKTEIEAIFNEMKTRDHSMYDSFVCCLLTHGADGGYIYGSDSEKVELNSLVSKLNAANCISLFGKPKLFFIQACRGKGKSPAVHLDRIDRVESDSDTPMILPNETDFFFGYATTPTMVAWRDLDNGSWYVNELCRTLCEHSPYADLTSMHEIIQRKVAEMYEINDFKQTAENNSRLTKKVYFLNR